MRLIPVLIRIFRSPIRLCIIIIIQIIFCSIEIIFHKNNIWLNLIFLIIFFGGLIVLFIYVRSVSQNELINFNVKLSPLVMVSGLFLQWDYFNIANTNLCPGIICFNKIGWWLSSILIVYLFVVIVIVVKITNPNNGALRTL